jgi:hypothetical protein
MLNQGNIFIIGGIMLILIGIIFSGKFGIGRLPGDIIISRPNFTFYFPITTMILASIVLTVILSVFRK